MNEHPKLPDIVERLMQYKQDPLMREAADEIERLRSPAPAEQHKDDWNIQGAVERENERTRLSAPAEDGLREALEKILAVNDTGDMEFSGMGTAVEIIHDIARAALSSGRDGRKT